MPLADRSTRESELAAALASIFVAARTVLENGAEVNWNGFASEVGRAVAQSTAATFAAAAGEMMAKHGDGAKLDLPGAQTSTQTADRANAYGQVIGQRIASGVVANIRANIGGAGGAAVDPGYWLSGRQTYAIAITETTAAIREGNKFAAALLLALLPMRQVRRFRTSEDDRVCPVCSPWNGKVDPEVEEPLHPGCRCETEYEFVPLIFAPLAGV